MDDLMDAFLERLAARYPFLHVIENQLYSELHKPRIIFRNEELEVELLVDIHNSKVDWICMYEKNYRYTLQVNPDVDHGRYIASLVHFSDQFYINLFEKNISLMSTNHPDNRANEKDVGSLERQWKINNIINE